MEDYMLPCMFKKFFGVDCIGCGLQRSLILVFKGRFSDAFYMFPAVYTSLLFFAFVGLFFIDKKHNYTNFVIGSAILNACIMIIAYVYKMRFLY